jgi:hypothetical protein
MKLSDVTTKLTCVKSKAVRVLAAATLAGAVLTVVAPAAQAQQFAIGVQFGGPRYVAPAPVYYGQQYGVTYVDRRRAEEFREHEAWERQQAWARQQAFERQERWEREHRFYDRDHARFDRDRFDRDRR